MTQEGIPNPAVRRMVGHDGSVYFVDAFEADKAAFFKIGWSREPAKRVRHLQTGCPFRLRLRGSISGGPADEQALHRAFAPWATGGEWFRAAPELAGLIDWILARDGASLASMDHLLGLLNRTYQRLGAIGRFIEQTPGGPCLPLLPICSEAEEGIFPA